MGLHKDYDEKLSAYDMDEDERDSSLKCLSFAIASIYVAWTRREIEGTVDDVINSIDRIRNDYIEGTARRYAL